MSSTSLENIGNTMETRWMKSVKTLSKRTSRKMLVVESTFLHRVTQKTQGRRPVAQYVESTEMNKAAPAAAQLLQLLVLF